jgi:PII-like signaling protein
MSEFTKATLLRIFVNEEDRWENRPLYMALVEALRVSGVTGASVLKGIEGYGASGRLHAARSIDYSSNLPVLIEVADSDESIRAVLPKLRAMIAEGLLTTETIRMRLVMASE